jgi:hypothetical protein
LRIVNAWGLFHGRSNAYDILAAVPFRRRAMSDPSLLARVACRIVALALLVSAATARAQDLDQASDYQPGQGWHVPGTNVGVGGYGALSYENLSGNRATLAIDEVSLLLHWENDGRLRLFAELSLESPLVYTPSTGQLTGRSYLALERLYGDFLYSERLSLRVGKFLTPIGRWNLIHADPLVWTTSRPLITEQAFPTNTTGAMVFGTIPVFGHPVDYSVYGALGTEWRPNPNLDPFTEAYGAHFSTALSPSSDLGLSLVSFEQRSSVGERRKLVGLDYVWARDRYELSAEAAYRFSDHGSAFDEKGLFVQAVVPLSARLYGVARYEFYDPAGSSAADINLSVLGLAYRASPALVLKMDLRHGGDHDPLAPDGVQASLAFLF